uniref:PPP1R2 family member C n=1 Tax=Otolemur garnettii TaxID=30611 RepID=H0XJ27_OTOGA
MAAYTASHRPIKGILKNKGSMASSAAVPAQQSAGTNQEKRKKKSQKWDESSILATYRPAYRDYGLMKINEPGTPHISVQDDGDDIVSDIETKEATSLDILTKKLSVTDTSESNSQAQGQESSDGNAAQILLDLQERQRQFEMKRKLHYTEGLNIKLARQLMWKDLQGEGEEDEKEGSLQARSEDSDEALLSDEIQIQPRNS